MKSVIIKDANNRILFHIKDLGNGKFDGKVATDISGYVSVKVIADNNSRVIMHQSGGK